MVTLMAYGLIAAAALWVAFLVGFISGIDLERGRAKR